MTTEAFFDTNILIYAIEDDPRANESERLLALGGTVSIQVLNEFVYVCQRKKRLALEQVTETLAALRPLLNIVPVTLKTHERGLEIAARYQLNIYDGLIAAAALEAGCTTLYSEDLQHGLRIDKQLRIVNPFR